MKRRAALLRRLYLKVHPDLFEVHPAAQRVNDASFKTLQGLLNCSSSSSVLHFFVEETSSADDSPPTLRSVQAQVRAGAAFERCAGPHSSRKAEPRSYGFFSHCTFDTLNSTRR